MGWKQAIVAAVAGLSLALTATWCTGFAYWRCAVRWELAKSKRALRDQRPIGTTWRLPYVDRAGSRAIPPILQEMKQALSDRDEQRMQMLLVNLACVASMDPDPAKNKVADPDGPYGDIAEAYWNSPASGVSKGYDEILQWWEQHRREYPPSWMWWRGTRTPRMN